MTESIVKIIRAALLLAGAALFVLVYVGLQEAKRSYYPGDIYFRVALVALAALALVLFACSSWLERSISSARETSLNAAGAALKASRAAREKTSAKAAQIAKDIDDRSRK